jgi:hypothetical protein
VFVLGGCIANLEYHDYHMSQELKRYKNDFFGRDDFILHTADLARRRGVFQRLTNKDLRERFYQETNRLMASLDYTVVACVIKKEAHLHRYGLAAMDPYMLSLRILV